MLLLTSFNHKVGDINTDINRLLTIISGYCRYSLANLVWSTTVEKLKNCQAFASVLHMPKSYYTSRRGHQGSYWRL